MTIRVGEWERGRRGDAESQVLTDNRPLSLSPTLPLFVKYPLRHRSGDCSPPRCSDVSFIVKHLPRAVDPETALHGKPYAPTQGGWPREIPQFRAADDEASA